MSDKLEIINSLVEMGFDRTKAELACNRTNPQNVNDAMDWILSHEDELVNLTDNTEANVTISTTDEQPNVVQESQSDSEPTATTTQVAKSIKCEDCGKIFKSQVEIEFHAAKSGHEHFTESTEEKKPLTEEEKREQLASIEAKLKQRRLEREAREKQEALEREKNRIKSGKEIQEAKKKQEELEIKKLVEQKRRDKEEERLAKQRVREQIEQDKLMRKAKFGGGQVETAPAPAPLPKQEEISKPPITDYTEVKLQIRLTDGSVLVQTFSAKEPLSAVRLYVEMNRKDGWNGDFDLMVNYPKKIFSTEDYQKPLLSLGLAPSAVLIVTKSV